MVASRGATALEISYGDIDVDEFRDPFFVDTLQRLPKLGLCLRQMPRRLLPGVGALSPDAAPAGVILQISRCGSTLLANLLREVRGCVVYSEPPAINDLLMPPYGDWSEDEIVTGLRLMAAELSAAGGRRPYVLKLRSWNVLRADLVLRAFPESPWIFLTRDPVEVAASVLRKPPTWLRAHLDPNNPFLPYLDAAAATADRETYVAHVLAGFAQAISGVSRTSGKLVRYEDFGSETWNAVAAHFSLSPSAEDRARMKAQAGLYSKDILRLTPFTSDAAAKQAEASPLLRSAVAGNTLPVFERLARSWSQA